MKFRLVYLPFLYCFLGTVLGYTLLNGVLLSHFRVTEEFRNLYVPLFLPLIPLYIWLRPGVRLLKFKNTARDPLFGMLLIAWVFTEAPLLIAQAYLSTATGKLTRLDQVHEISTVPLSRFYTIRNFSEDTVYSRHYYMAQVTGKYSENLELYYYIVSPMYDKDTVATLHSPQVEAPEPDTSIVTIGYATTAPPTPTWRGERYHRVISNRLKGAARREKMEQFVQSALVSHAQISDTGITYFDAIPYSDDYIRFLKAVKKSDLFPADSTLRLLEAERIPFEDRNGQKPLWMLGTLAGGMLLYWLLLLIFPMKEPVT